MARTKSQQNAMLLDPNRERIAKQNAVVPGGPENNSPYPVEQSVGTPVTATSIYGDYKQQYPQMGTAVINPMETKPSGLQQNFPTAGRGKNNVPYGMQQQPDASGRSPMWEMMEGERLSHRTNGLPTSPMGLIGGPPIMGSLPGDLPGTSGPPLMQGNQSIVPGSTPQKIYKKKGGKK